MSWTQPICEDCWEQQNPGRIAHKMKEEFRDTEICAFCGKTHRSGIYTRANPLEIPFPQQTTD